MAWRPHLNDKRARQAWRAKVSSAVRMTCIGLVVVPQQVSKVSWARLDSYEVKQAVARSD